jgi:hypothetical protein
MGGVMALVAGCGGGAPAESDAFKQAVAVHEGVVAQSDSLHEVIAGKLGMVRDSLAYAQTVADSAGIERWTTLEAQLNTVDLQFHDWAQTVVEVPGHVHDHGDHAGHDHGDGDHAGHDHGHDHGHGGAEGLEGMGDEEVLKIQQALKAQLDEIEAQLNGLGL